MFLTQIRNLFRFKRKCKFCGKKSYQDNYPGFCSLGCQINHGIKEFAEEMANGFQSFCNGLNAFSQRLNAGRVDDAGSSK